MSSDWWGRTALYIVIDRKESVGGGRGGAGGRGGGALEVVDGLPQLLAARVRLFPAAKRKRDSARPQVWTSSTGCWPRMSIPIRSSICIAPAGAAIADALRTEQLNTGCTPLFRATEAGDMEVIRALLAKGANPNINAMGFTPFLVAAGVDPGGRGGGGAPNTTLLDLMIQHGADVNAQVTGTRTYSMRISYHPPPDKEGDIGSPRSGAGGPDGPGSLPSGEGSQSRARRCQRQEADRSGSALGGDGGGRGRGGAPARRCFRLRARSRRSWRRWGGGVSPATAAEIRAMLQDAASKK